jgi:hypothetical protein
MNSSKYTGSNLVYGELPSWYDLLVKTNIERAKKLYDYLTETKQNLLTEYISYILSKAGYNNKSIIDLHLFEKDEEVQTTNFTIDDWVKNIDGFHSREEYKLIENNDVLYEMYRTSDEWSVLFEDVFRKKIGINFAQGDLDWYTSNILENGSFSPVYSYLISKDENLYKNYLIIDPISYQKGKKYFNVLSRKISEGIDSSAVFTIDGFLHEMIKDQTQKNIIKESWIKIREEILSNIRSEYPFLYRAKHSKKIEKISKLVKDA